MGRGKPQAVAAQKHQKKLVGPATSQKPEMVKLPVQKIKSSSEAYYGGTAKQPHVHVYAKGCHLKLGTHRYNLVQNNTKYASAIADAYLALRPHALHDTLRPWVDAALRLYGADDLIPD